MLVNMSSVESQDARLNSASSAPAYGPLQWHMQLTIIDRSVNSMHPNVKMIRWKMLVANDSDLGDFEIHHQILKL